MTLRFIGFGTSPRVSLAQDARRWAQAAPPQAVEAIAQRLGEAARRRDLVRYGDLGRGVVLVHPDTGARIVIDTQGSLVHSPEQRQALDWIGIHLTAIASTHPEGGKIMPNALIVGHDAAPSPGFLKFSGAGGEHRGDRASWALTHWQREVARVHEWFARLPTSTVADA